MTQKDTWFDAFFQAVTTSPEFKWAMEKDWKGDMSKALKEMEENVTKAGDMAKAFQDTFATKEAIDIGNSMTAWNNSQMKDTKNAGEEEKERKLSVEVQYFTMKNPETFGFKGIAGMADLKKNLSESFIRPLKFKFMVEALERKEMNSPVLSDIPLDKGDKNRKLEEKEDLYRDLYAAYKKFQVTIPTGLLFYGPPGTGKTFITKKLAEELGAGMIKKSVGEFWSSYLHETSKNIRQFFSDAKKASEKGPIILFLDEIDSLVSKRTNNIDANKAEEVSQFLQEFNALSEAPNLIVIAATNRPDHLDSAILRSGRFDKKIYIWAPDEIARKELFQIYIEKESRPHEKLDYDELAKLTEGYVASDIEAICDEVSRDASQSLLDLAHSMDGENVDLEKIRSKLDNHFITMDLLKQAIADTTSSLKMVDMSIYEDWEKGLK